LIETVYVGRLYKIAAIFLEGCKPIPDTKFGEMATASGKVEEMEMLPDDSLKDRVF